MARKLAKMAAAKKMRNIGKGTLAASRRQGFRIDFQERFAVKLDKFDMIGADKLIFGAVFRQRKHRAIGKIGHVRSIKWHVGLDGI